MTFMVLRHRTQKTASQPFDGGQGVIEYAGAIVIAVLLLSMAMGASFDSLATVFTDIFTALGATLATYGASL